ncbi:MAG: LytTR family DNA-binding domain-containing protein [Ferruginibacter sp.]
MAGTISTLIIDDEFQSRRLVAKMLSLFFPEISIVNEAATVHEAISAIKSNIPQLVFLDIQLHQETGFDLLDKLVDPDFEIIFITAYNEFAIKAFRYNALDYLMKPLDAEEFQAAVKKALKQISMARKNSAEQIGFLKQQWDNPKKLPDRVVIPTTEGYMVIPVQDIFYCHANSNYTEFYLTDKTKLISSYTMGQYEEILSDHNFFRIHRSYMVNLAYIKMYRKGDGGTVIMNDGKEIEVSRSNKEAFMKLFKA